MACGASWILYFVSDSFKKRALSRTDHCTCLFVDFSKAFDTAGRTGIYQLLRKYGCPEKFTTIIEALHTGMMANVSVDGEVSESFSVTNEVEQGCVLAPTLFSIFLSAMLVEAFRDMGDGMRMSPNRLPRQIIYCLLVREREDALVSGSRIPSRQT